jgi:hypothetical protein
MNLEEKIRYHCQLVVEYKDVDTTFSQRNIEIIENQFNELLQLPNSTVSFSLMHEVATTILSNSLQAVSVPKTNFHSIEIPKNDDEFFDFLTFIISYFPRSEDLLHLFLFMGKNRTILKSNGNYKEQLFQCLNLCLENSRKQLALEIALVLKTTFDGDFKEKEELNTTIIAILASLGANEFARNYHKRFETEQTNESKPLRQYNLFLTYFNENNHQQVKAFWQEVKFDTISENVRRNYQRLYALHLARNQQNNEAKELLEQLANIWIEEKNTKEYLKIHNDIVSIIPNENVEKFSEYLTTIENIFEQSHSKEYLLTVYAKKHEYAKLLNKYEAISLAKSYLLATATNAYSILEEVAFQLSELAKKRKKTEEALEFLTVSLNAKNSVFEEILRAEKNKNEAEKLVLEYIGSF